MIHFPKTTLFQINSQSFKQNPIIRWRLVNEIKIKNKKKESKGKFQVYKKASSSPTGFWKNLHPYRFAITLIFDYTTSFPMMYRVVFFQKNLLFWNLPLERLAFFFSFFSFEKFNGRSVARHIGSSNEILRKIENLTHF